MARSFTHRYDPEADPEIGEPLGSSDRSTEAAVFTPETNHTCFVDTKSSQYVAQQEVAVPKPDVPSYEDEEDPVATHDRARQSRPADPSFGQHFLVMEGVQPQGPYLGVMRIIRGDSLFNSVLLPEELIEQISIVKVAMAAACLRYPEQSTIYISGRKVPIHRLPFCENNALQIPVRSSSSIMTTNINFLLIPRTRHRRRVQLAIW